MVASALSLAALAAGAVWFVLALLPWARRLVTNPGMWAFHLFALFLSLAAILEFQAFRDLSPDGTTLWLRGRDVALTLVALFLLFFTRWLSVGRERADLLLAVPTLVVALLTGLLPAGDPFPGLVRGGYLALYGGVGLAFLIGGARELPSRFRAEFLRVRAITVSLVVAAGGGVVARLPLALVVGDPSPWPVLLMLVGGAGVVASSLPIDRAWLSSLLRRLAREDLLQALLVYEGGTLLASRSRMGHTPLDEDVFTAVLEALQQFLRRSLRLGPGWLGAIDHGDVKILVERGDRCFLALVTTGREDDLLRGEMRRALARFEARNADALRGWRGDPGGLEGAQECVDQFFDVTPVF